jgi:hypothetical protein
VTISQKQLSRCTRKFAEVLDPALEPALERERLLGGNCKIRPAAGLYFKRGWCVVADAVPADLDIVRY